MLDEINIPGTLILTAVGYVCFFAMLVVWGRMDFTVSLFTKIVVFIALPFIAMLFAKMMFD